jgi:hypothetical protein
MNLQMNNPDFVEIYRVLNQIFDSEDEELVQILEDVVDEAYEAATHGINLPARLSPTCDDKVTAS